MTEQPSVLTVDEAAAILRLSRTSAFEGVRRGEIPHIRVGRRILIPRRQLERMLDGDTKEREPAEG